MLWMSTAIVAVCARRLCTSSSAAMSASFVSFCVVGEPCSLSAITMRVKGLSSKDGDGVSDPAPSASRCASFSTFSKHHQG